MAFSREIKIGALAIIVIAGMIWGYKFIIGQNLLSNSRTYYAVFDDVTNLVVSSPVKINGYQVGAVTGIELNPEDVTSMKVSFQIEDNGLKIPTDAEAIQAADGLVGGQFIMLKYDRNCSGADCAESGQELKGKVQGLLGSMLGEGELEETVNTVATGMKKVVDGLGDEDGKGALNASIRNIEQLTKNLAALTSSTNSLIQQSQRSMISTMKNVDEITSTLAADRGKITSLLGNLDTLTSRLAASSFDQTIDNSNKAITETTAAIKDFRTSLTSLETTFGEVNGLLTKINKGDGSLSQLLNDKQLYTNLEFTSRNLALLLQDLRLNPKRYVSISVFGGGGDEYIKPEDDPALKGEFIIQKVPKNKE